MNIYKTAVFPTIESGAENFSKIFNSSLDVARRWSFAKYEEDMHSDFTKAHCHWDLGMNRSGDEVGACTPGKAAGRYRNIQSLQSLRIYNL